MKHNKFDIAEDMFRNLNSEAVENKTQAAKLAKALECLNKAANLLDNIKDHKSAEKITNVMEKLASSGK